MLPLPPSLTDGLKSISPAPPLQIRYDPKTRLHTELATMPDRRYRGKCSCALPLAQPLDPMLDPRPTLLVPELARGHASLC